MINKNCEISIVIPTYNKVERLRLTLCSLAQIKEISEVQVIVVDDGSTDSTMDFLMQYREIPHFRSIHTSNAGRSSARNRGIEVAHGSIIVFTDDDILFDMHFLSQHKLSHENNENTLVHGSIYNLPYVKFFKDPSTGTMMNGESLPKALAPFRITPEKIINNFNSIIEYKKIGKFEKDIQQLFECAESVRDYHWICCTGGNISVKRKILEQNGGFDVGLGLEWGCEDLELGYRLWKNGSRFLINREAVNYHLSHFRANGETIHKAAMQYFIQKHNDDKIERLADYFEGNIKNLLVWAEGKRL